MRETDKRLVLLRGETYPGMATMRWAADEVERLRYLEAAVRKLHSGGFVTSLYVGLSEQEKDALRVALAPLGLTLSDELG